MTSYLQRNEVWSSPEGEGPDGWDDTLMERECTEVQHPEDSDSLWKGRRRSLLAALKVPPE